MCAMVLPCLFAPSGNCPALPRPHVMAEHAPYVCPPALCLFQRWIPRLAWRHLACWKSWCSTCLQPRARSPPAGWLPLSCPQVQRRQQQQQQQQQQCPRSHLRRLQLPEARGARSSRRPSSSRQPGSSRGSGGSGSRSLGLPARCLQRRLPSSSSSSIAASLAGRSMACQAAPGGGAVAAAPAPPRSAADRPAPGAPRSSSSSRSSRGGSRVAARAPGARSASAAAAPGGGGPPAPRPQRGTSSSGAAAGESRHHHCFSRPAALQTSCQRHANRATFAPWSACRMLTALCHAHAALCALQAAVSSKAQQAQHGPHGSRRGRAAARVSAARRRRRRRRRLPPHATRCASCRRIAVFAAAFALVQAASGICSWCPSVTVFSPALPTGFPQPGASPCLASACLFFSGLPRNLEERELRAECAKHSKVRGLASGTAAAGWHSRGSSSCAGGNCCRKLSEALCCPPASLPCLPICLPPLPPLPASLPCLPACLPACRWSALFGLQGCPAAPLSPSSPSGGRCTLSCSCTAIWDCLCCLAERGAAAQPPRPLALCCASTALRC
jgi:hypothetical protein